LDIQGAWVNDLAQERDCLSAGTSASECTNDRIGCQSGNGINGAVSPLNAESATPGKRVVRRQFSPGQNTNQGSDRPVILQQDGTAIVSGIHAANDDLGCQIACLLDVSDDENIRPHDGYRQPILAGERL
jgi:hypothetical protein